MIKEKYFTPAIYETFVMMSYLLRSICNAAELTKGFTIPFLFSSISCPSSPTFLSLHSGSVNPSSLPFEYLSFRITRSKALKFSASLSAASFRKLALRAIDFTASFSPGLDFWATFCQEKVAKELWSLERCYLIR